MAMPSTSAPTLASTSRTHRPSGRFTRTSTSAPPRRTCAAAAVTASRAAAFSETGTLSSRSSMMASAPRVCAFSMKRGTFAGT